MILQKYHYIKGRGDLKFDEKYEVGVNVNRIIVYVEYLRDKI
jgi:hypothetical protein